MGMKDKTKAIAAKFRLDSHHAIERFGVFFAAIAASFVLVFVSASTSSIANQREQMDTTTVYTPSLTTSKTQLSVEVPTIYINRAKTRAMVLMQFDDAGSISANAKKYQGFLTGSNKDLGSQALKTDITGQIVVFGSTGYMAEILDSSRPFEQQIVNLTMRANSELVYKPADGRKVRSDLEGQKTFSQFDQWRVYFNPGAKGTKVTKALDGKAFDASAVYNQIIVSPEEKTARTTMEDALGQMRVDLARIAEYESDLRRVSIDGVSLVQPKVPTQIAGDEVTGEPGANGKASTLELKPKWVSPAGYDFEWRSGTVATGYLDDLVPKGDSYVTWLADKHEASKDEDASTVTIPDDAWKLSNGRLLSDYDSGDTAMEPLFDIRNNLSQAYQDYYKDKLAYQVDDYEALINLEIQLRNVQTTASMNDSAKALFTY